MNKLLSLFFLTMLAMPAAAHGGAHAGSFFSQLMHLLQSADHMVLYGLLLGGLAVLLLRSPRQARRAQQRKR